MSSSSSSSDDVEEKSRGEAQLHVLHRLDNLSNDYWQIYILISKNLYAKDPGSPSHQDWQK